MSETANRAAAFRTLHRPGDPLRLANAWDAGSARLIEGCGAKAIATTSAGLAWANGYPDGDVLPTGILVRAVEAIVRVIGVPLSVDAEGGYADEPATVGRTVRQLIDAGAVGINIEDGSKPPDLLCDKIEAVRTVAANARVPLFVNARTDVYLRRLVEPDRALDETLARAERYRAAGADGLFVPAVSAADAIRAIVAAIDLPLNVLVVPGLPPVAELASLGVARVSAGSRIAQTALGVARAAATQFLVEGLYDAMAERTAQYAELNAIFAAPTGPA